MKELFTSAVRADVTGQEQERSSNRPARGLLIAPSISHTEHYFFGGGVRGRQETNDAIDVGRDNPNFFIRLRNVLGLMPN